MPVKLSVLMFVFKINATYLFHWIIDYELMNSLINA